MLFDYDKEAYSISILEAFEKFDSGLILWIQENLRNPVLDKFFVLVTRLGDKGIIWIILSLFLIIPKKTRRIGIMCLVALIISLLFNNIIIKNIIKRSRPFHQITDLRNLVNAKGYSFPSGHTSSSFACATVMFGNLPKKYGIVMIMLAALIGFSRIYTGVHYPLDVLGGIVTGLLSSYISQHIINRICFKVYR